MPKIFTLDELRSWTAEKRRDVYQNAKKSPEGKYIIDLIEQNGLSLSSGGLSLDDPVHLRIVEIAWSIAGQQAAIDATQQGIPALCGVDLLLQAELGDLYGKHDLGTASAGAVVAAVMRHRGFREAGSGKCPPNCTVRTAMKWR
jgi:hypothetical protein